MANIDLTCNTVQYILRTWRFSRALSFIESATSTPETSPLRKINFLLLLTTGGRTSKYTLVSGTRGSVETPKIRKTQSPFLGNTYKLKQKPTLMQVSKIYPVSEEVSSSTLR